MFLYMGMNETPSSERVHIGFFGRRNAGKSSLVNAVTGQDLSIVSEVRGTTTDPVSKSMELLPLGPVVIIDTPGIDDEGELGIKRVGKSRQVLNKTDLAILVVDATTGTGSWETVRLFEKRRFHILLYTIRQICSRIPPRQTGKPAGMLHRLAFPPELRPGTLRHQIRQFQDPVTAIWSMSVRKPVLASTT